MGSPFPLGSFANERDLVLFIRHGQDFSRCENTETQNRESVWRDLIKMSQLQNEMSHQICLCHGDISESHILVRKGKAVGLIDFEKSGFCPECWEYTVVKLNKARYYEFLSPDIFKFFKA